MADDFRADVTIESNRQEYIEEFDRVVEKILTMIGLECESAAKLLAPVDTGLLRNSITFALAGKSANITSYKSSATHANTEATRAAGTAGKRVSPVKTGKYKGKSEPNKEPGVRYVHIGTNVEYAMDQETGNFKDGPHAFLRPAINNNTEHFKTIVEEELKKAMQEPGE